MLKKVWFAKKLEAGEDVITHGEFGRAPFVLVVEYVYLGKEKYRVKARVKARDGEVAALIQRHKLERLDIYIDRTAEALDAKRKSLREEREEGLSRDGLAFIFSDGLASVVIRELVTWVKSQQAVKISFGTLLQGIEISGTMQELRWLVRELTTAIDRLGVEIDTGEAFDAGELRIYAPGKKIKVKEGKRGTSPSEWVK